MTCSSSMNPRGKGNFVPGAGKFRAGIYDEKRTDSCVGESEEHHKKHGHHSHRKLREFIEM